MRRGREFGALLLLAGALAAQGPERPAHPERPERDLRGTVAGLGEKPARVTLWQNDMNRRACTPVGDTVTGADGAFAFRKAPWVTQHEWGFHSFLLVAQDGKRIGLHTLRGVDAKVDGIRIELRNTFEISGKVIDARSGQPIAGADVWPMVIGDVNGPSLAWVTAPMQPWATQSNAEGRFIVRMLPAVDQITFVASHRDHARCQFRIEGREPTIEVPMEPGSRISGTVVMPDGSPAVRVEVACQGHGMGYGWTVTDERGAFTLEGLAADTYKVWAEATDLTVFAVAGIQLAAGDHVEKQKLQLTPGGFIVGRVLDAATGQPIVPLPSTDVAMYGPARPRGGACEVVPVQADGTFRIRAPAGTNFIYLRGLWGWSEPGENVEVVEGKETPVVWRVTRAAAPPKKQP